MKETKELSRSSGREMIWLHPSVTSSLSHSILLLSILPWMRAYFGHYSSLNHPRCYTQQQCGRSIDLIYLLG